MSARVIDWYSMGWQRAYQQCNKLNVAPFYPTRDIYSSEDEEKYLQGYTDGVETYYKHGFLTIEAYGNEHDETN